MSVEDGHMVRVLMDDRIEEYILCNLMSQSNCFPRFPLFDRFR